MCTYSHRRLSVLLVLVCILLGALSACRTSPQDKEAKYLKRGEALANEKDYPRALLEFRNAAAAMPNDAEPYYQMGLVHLKSRDFSNAARAFQKAITLNPKHAGAQLKIAEILANANDQQFAKDAISRIQTIFGDSPNDPDAIATLAVAEWKLGEPEKASELLEGALKKFPTHLQSSVNLTRMKLKQKDWNGAEEVLKKAVADAPKSSDAALALGNLYVVLKQPEKAELQFKRALQMDPKNGSALMSWAALQVAAKRLDDAEKTYKEVAALPERAYKPVHALFLYQIGRRDAAVAEFEVLAKSDENDREARTRLVQAYFTTNRNSDAEKVLATALKRNPKDTDALLQRAGWRLQLGKPDDAEKDLKEVLHFATDSALAHFLLARVYETKGLVNNQQQELQEALRLNANLLLARISLSRSLLSSKQAQRALDVMDQAPEAQKTALRWILARNWALLSLGNSNEAGKGISRALEQGRVPEAVFQHAVLQFLQKNYDVARTEADELLKRDVVDPNVVNLLMQTYIAKQESSKGIDRLKELAATQPKAAQLQYLLGEWCRRTGNPQGARKAFENAQAADPRFTAATLALAELDVAEGQSGAANQKLGAILASDPQNINARMLLARAQDESGDRVGEIETYRAILAVEPSNLLALNNLAYRLAANSPDEALNLAQQAVERAPDEPSCQDTLGWIYYRKGLYSMAVQYLKTAVEKGPNPRRQFHLGMSYLKMGERAAGQKLVTEALQKDPNLAKTEQGW